MAAIIVQNEIQSHKVMRRLLSTRHSVEEESTSFYTEFTIAKNPKNYFPLPALAFTRTSRTTLHALEPYPGSSDKAYCEIH